MSEVRIAAEPRTEFGKGGARRTRRAGKVPAVMYGHGTAPRHIALPARDFAQAIKHGINTLLTIDIDGKSELALPKAIQRDPLRGTFDHVDLLLVRRGEKVTVEIPVNLVGEAARDGLVNHEMTSMTIEAEATHLPDGIEVSIDGLVVGDQILAGQVTLPHGSILIGDPDAMVVAIAAAPSAADVEADLAGGGETPSAESSEEAPAS
ncbi:MAG: large subunit ribosomal protein [Kribbellaceae bacterium]|nr:large subunit ribosomal protein [Kribbellaceae bacterium]